MGPCSPAGQGSMHPILLGYASSQIGNICPIDPISGGPFRFPYNYSDMMTHDICENADADESKTLTDLQIIFPKLTFDPVFFLKEYYGIHNHEEGIEWLEKNSELNHITKERVFNQLIVLYSDIINLIDTRIIKHIRNILLYKIQLIFRSISKYIIINSDKIIFSKPDPDKIKQDITDVKSIALVNTYIKTKLISENEVINFIDKILITGIKNMTKEQKENFTAVVVDIMIDYITQRIEISLK
jgi:hypothetical protein